MVSPDGGGLAKPIPERQDWGWRAELLTHMLAERCCWEPGRLAMAGECPGDTGAGWYVLTCTDRKDSQAEPVSTQARPSAEHRKAWHS